MKTTRAAAVTGFGAAAALTAAIVLGGPAAQGATTDAVDVADGADRVSGRSDFNAMGLTDDGRLVSFETRYPRDIDVIGAIAGLVGDAEVIGMDYRPLNELLYAVGDAGGIYTVSEDTAALTKVAQTSVVPSGASFGVDFNPAADRLRVISDTGQNLRIDVSTGATTVDGSLTYPPVPPADPVPGVGVTAAAYTNNDLDPTTGTTLFDIDTVLDQVVLQAPANAGLLSATGKLGFDVGTDGGFDIYSKIRKGRSVEASGYAVLSVDGRYRGFIVNLLNGDLNQVRTFPRSIQVVDVAMPLNQR